MLSKLFKPKTRDSKGFTLIEIVIVLAIAGLIFVIVFLAVQQAQKARRDTQRRADASRYLAAAEQYAGNNNGDYPTVNITATYLTNGGGTFNDPTTGSPYTVAVGTATPGAAGGLSASRNAQCAATGGTATAGGGNRAYAVVVFQESGGSFCVDNT
jgi:prepilin-type N-terminal cleavage/methylation domain-containing protein